MIAEGEVPLERIGNSDLFEWRGEPSSVPERYRLIWRDVDHREHIAHDPYVYPPLLSQADLELFARGAHHAPYEFLGAREREIDGVAGVLFAVWAPNAERVSVVGDFNQWDGRRHPMRVRHNGVWELFVPDLAPGALYKYEIRNRDSGALFLKADPYGRAFERRPQTASIVPAMDTYGWN
ncbi:MAG: 1,4-alpha-glucan branching enzyme, partial [Acidobacteria bacterium]